MQFKSFAMEHNEIYVLAAKVYAKLALIHASGNEWGYLPL
jgi:hypothetical protein